MVFNGIEWSLMVFNGLTETAMEREREVFNGVD